MPIKKKTLLMHFAANLKAARENTGMSQEALAHIAGLHRTFVGQVERGKRNLSINNIERLADALGIEPAELVARKNKSH